MAGLAAMAFGLASGPWVAIAARVLVGLGVGLVLVHSMKILTAWFKPDQFGRMMGVLMGVGGLGMLLAAAPLAYLSAWLSWRISFVVTGAATSLIALAVYIWVRDRPSQMGLPEVVDQAALGRSIGLKEGLGLVAGHKSFWVMAVWKFFQVGTMFSFAGLWGGPYLMEVYGLDKPAAGNILSMIAVGTVAGSPLIGWLSDSVLRSRKLVVVGCSLVFLAWSLVTVLWPGRLPLAALYLHSLVLGFTASAVVVVIFTSVKELFPLRIAGTATGLVNLFPFFGGAFLQVAVGWMLEGRDTGGDPAESYGRAFTLYLAAAAISLVCSFFMKDTHPARAGERGGKPS
jgi:sugar phosphate permease